MGLTYFFKNLYQNNRFLGNSGPSVLWSTLDSCGCNVNRNVVLTKLSDNVDHTSIDGGMVTNFQKGVGLQF